MGTNLRPELERLLLEAGCYFVRNGQGDHAVWHSPVSGMSFPGDGKIVSRHTANGVLK